MSIGAESAPLVAASVRPGETGARVAYVRASDGEGLPVNRGSIRAALGLFSPAQVRSRVGRDAVRVGLDRGPTYLVMGLSESRVGAS